MTKTKAERKTASPTSTNQSDIRPALDVAEWLLWRSQRINPVTMMREIGMMPPAPDNLVKTIAIANDQLHDDDPRKFRLDHVELLLSAAQFIDQNTPELKGDGSDEPLTVETVRIRGEAVSALDELAQIIDRLLPPAVAKR